MTEVERLAEVVERTRSTVLNILIVVGSGIAVSGILLRWRDRWAETRAPRATGSWLLIALCVLIAASHLYRRRLCGRAALQDPRTRTSRFYRGHVVAAMIGALAIPLGLVYGWLIRPRLDAVAPFWVAAMAMGFLSFPRLAEIEDLDDAGDVVPPTPDSESEPSEPMIS